MDPVNIDVTNPSKSISLFEDWLSSAWVWFLDFIPKFIVAILIFIIGWWLSSLITKLVKKTMLKAHKDLAAVSFICSLTKCTLRIFVIISFVAQLGVNITTLLTAIGAATVTIGLALQDTMGNIASGVLIILNKPFKVGDFIEFDGEQGTIKKILITNTHLDTVDNREIIIPNKRLTESKVINYNANELRRVDLTFSIGYDTDILKAKNLIRDMLKKEKLVNQDTEPIIGVFSHDDSNIKLHVKVWCAQDVYWDLYYKIQEDIKYLFDKNNITIPFPQVTIHTEKQN